MADAAGSLLGRDGPLRLLRQALSRAAAGDRSAVLVTGQAGIGKSTLVRSAVAGAPLVGWGTCVEGAAAPGYWPWTQALGGLAAAIGHERTIEAASGDLDLLGALGRAFGGGAATVARSDQDRLMLMDAVSRWLTRVAADTPVVLVLDDLHWADESSVLLLELVARDPSPAAVCVIGAYRTDELTPSTRARLSGLALSAVSVDLIGLDREAACALAVAVAGPLSDDDADELYRRAGGHPVFTRELALLHGDGDHRRIPTALRDAIGARFTRLPDLARRALQVAALAGNQVQPSLVATASGLTPEEVDDALVAAEVAGIVVVEDGTSRFTHDLYRETIDALVTSSDRAALHQRIGAALEDRHERGGDVSPAELARHFTAAVVVDGPARAARWSLAAAAHDRDALAFREAVTHLRRWRATVATLSDPVDLRDLVEVLLAEADVLARSGAPVDARGLLRLARAKLQPEGPADLSARVALAVSDLGSRFAARRDEVIAELEQALAGVEGLDARLEAQLMATLARELRHSIPADRPLAEPLSERALELGRAAGDAGTLLTCLLARHDVLWTPGEAEPRRAVAEEIVAAADRLGDDAHRAQGQLLLANALLELGSAAFLPALESCLDGLERMGQPRHRYMAETRRAALLLLRGRLDAAEEAVAAAAALGARIREPDTENVRMSQRLEVVRGRGDDDELRDFAAAAISHWTGAPVHAHAVAAGFTARAGDLEASRHHVDAVLDSGTWQADRSYLWSVLVRELAVAAMALDDRTLCEELLGDVYPLADSCGVNGAVVAFAGSHGHVAGLLLEHLGRDGSAQLAAAAATYRRLGATGWLSTLEPRSAAPGGPRSMRRQGAAWVLTFDGRVVTVPHVKGLADLAMLVARPDSDVHVLDLYGASVSASASAPVVDGRALQEYRRRLADLDAEIDAAAVDNDLGRRERAEAERSELITEVQRVTSHRGGSRVFANYPAERARKAVAARIRDAIRRVEASHPALATHLDASIVTGTHCRYRSDSGAPWQVDPS